MKLKIPKQQYTAEFKELVVKRVKAGQGIGAVARELGLVEQTLRNWVKAAAAGERTWFWLPSPCNVGAPGRI